MPNYSFKSYIAKTRSARILNSKPIQEKEVK